MRKKKNKVKRIVSYAYNKIEEYKKKNRFVDRHICIKRKN